MGGHWNASDLWQEWQIEVLRREWLAGTLISAIGAMLGKSRSATAGKANRLGLPRRPSPVKRPADGSLSMTRTAIRKRGWQARQSAARLNSTPGSKSGGRLIAPVAYAVAALPVWDGAPLPDAPPRPARASQPRWGLCQMPRGDRPYNWCGAPAPVGEPYCPTCRAICWQAPPRREAA